MNSTRKGDKLENELYRYLLSELKADRLPFKKRSCKVFRKKAYYSKDRDANIVFDVSIEIRIKGQAKYSFLWLFECKNYNTSIQVNEIEEFHSKVTQITDSNTKAVLVTKSECAKSTLMFARSKGIGLLRFHNDRSVKWELARSIRSRILVSNISSEASNSLLASLTSQAPMELYSRVTILSGNILSNQIADLFIAQFRRSVDLRLAKELVRTSIGSRLKSIRFYSIEDLDNRAEEVLAAINYKGGYVDLNAICAFEKRKCGLRVTIETDRLPFEEMEGQLGSISFDPLEIVIYAYATKEHIRQRFTLAHELGHFYLGHADYFSKEKCDLSDINSHIEECSVALANEKRSGMSLVERLEWQANYFASALLLPRRMFTHAFETLVKKYGLLNKRQVRLFVDSQRCNRDNYTHFMSELTMQFDVSRTAISIRAEKLGLLQRDQDVDY